MLKIISEQTFKDLELAVNNFIVGKEVKWIKVIDLENLTTTRKTAYIFYK